MPSKQKYHETNRFKKIYYQYRDMVVQPYTGIIRMHILYTGEADAGQSGIYHWSAFLYSDIISFILTGGGVLTVFQKHIP